MLALAQVSAAGFGQTITLNEKNTPIEKVLLKIRQQSGYEFIYDVKDLKGQKVSLKLANASVEEAVKSSLEGLPIAYTILDKNIVLKKKEASFIDNIIARFRAIDVRGRILDEQNQPLVGASVNVKGKSLATKTDGQGNFYLTNVDEKATLVISFVGFKSIEVGAKEDLGILLLKLDDNSLEQVQVIAYGEVKQKFATSNISSISGETISRQPVTNPLMALQGRAPGLFVQQVSGLSTGSINVTVQGRNSLRNGNQPFYVIDGVPYIPNSISTLSVGVLAGPTSNLNFINPSDIESITILKDADATAIYGSRAANGAILITTKRGKPGQTKVNLNLQSGWSKVARKQDLLNGSEYISMRREALKNNNNETPSDYDYDINGAWDPNRDNDWQKELLGGTAQFQNLQASISGGSDHTQFLVGAGYIRETTVFDGDFSNVKANVNFNINNVSPNGKFRYFLSGSYLNGLNRLPQSDLTESAISLLSPNAPMLYLPDGTINWDIDPANPNIARFGDYPVNPVASLLMRYKDRSNNLLANSQISYEPLPGLSLKSTFGYNRLENAELATIPLTSYSPPYRSFSNRLAKYGSKSITTWIIEPQITFNKSYSFGNIDALIGSTFQNTDNYVLNQEGSGYSSDAQLPNLNAAGTKRVITSLQSQYKYNAIFGRLNYRFSDRYIVNLSARRDGSSRFGSENLFHNFYSIGGAWLFAEEDFFKKVLPVINYGKLRATYGTSGNDQIGDYSFYSLYDNYSVAIPYQGVVGLYPRSLSNPYLQWEETKKMNFGVDLGFFASRILIKADYFRNRSSNQLIFQNLTWVTGFNGITRNLPATVQNTGWEFTLDYTPIKGSTFTWTGSANITIPKNKLTRYDGLTESGDNNNFIIGESINIKKVFQYEGVNPVTGLYEFVNSKGEITSAPVDPSDKIRFVNLDPKWYGGFSNAFSFKGFDLDIFFQFSKQKILSNRFGNFPGFYGQQPKIVVDRWHKPGDIAEIQKVSTNFGEIYPSLSAATASDAVYSDAAYLRLKNVALSYTINNSVLKRARISTARLFVQGQNLLTFTKFFGGADPETGSTTRLGTLRTITVGTQLTF